MPPPVSIHLRSPQNVHFPMHSDATCFALAQPIDVISRNRIPNVTRRRSGRPSSPYECAPAVLRMSAQPAKPSKQIENLVIIGSGPAGYTAAIYAARANLRPMLLEGMASGVPGGQLMTTEDVENFPGFPDGITGPELMSNMRSQAERWGTRLLPEDATAVDLDTAPFTIKTSDAQTIRAHSVVIATGASAKRLGIPGEAILWGRGISACAICDGTAPIFNGVPLAVIGGGDSACEEAVYLCKYATHVHLLVRGGTLRASKTLVDRVVRHPSITIHFHTSVVRAMGITEAPRDGGSPLTSLKVRRSDTGAEDMLDVRGLFYAIGHTPNTKFLKGSSLLRFDRSGYLITREGSPSTGQDGVFAAGDVADPVWRQAVTAAGSGCMAALAAERFLAEHGLTIEYHQDEEMLAAGVAAARGTLEESSAERAADERGADDEQSYDLEETWHFGEFALRKLYHESQRPLIVKYISPSCGPCKQLKPMLNAVVRDFESQVHYVEIDITKDMTIAEAAGVTGSPTVQIFHSKSLVKEFRGVQMKSEYRRVVEDILSEVSVR